LCALPTCSWKARCRFVRASSMCRRVESIPLR
jgi:hypothetical protein